MPLIKSSPMFDVIEVIREVPRMPAPIHDGGDIDSRGSWYGPEMGCLTCREVSRLHVWATSTYMVVALGCDECGEEFARYRI